MMNQMDHVTASPSSNGTAQKPISVTRGSRTEMVIANLVAYVLLFLGAALFMLPFLYLVSTAMKTMAETNEFPPRIIPRFTITSVVSGRSYPVFNWTERENPVARLSKQADGTWLVQPLDRDLKVEGKPVAARNQDLAPRSRPSVFADNLHASLTILPFARYLVNTLIIVVLTIAGTTLSAALCAYGFARIRFRGREPLFILLLATMMIPGQVTMIPVYILFKELGWINTYLPLIVPAFFGGGAFSIFLLRQFFRGIPYEMEEAARIDGCGPLATWWRIVLPLSFPALATVAIFSFMGAWNDYMGPLIYINDTDKFTLALGLSLFKGQYGVDTPHLMMAATLVVLIPVLLLFFFAQKHFIQGIVISGVKG